MLKSLVSVSSQFAAGANRCFKLDECGQFFTGMQSETLTVAAMAGVTELNGDSENIVKPAPGATDVAAASNGNSLVAYRSVSGSHTTVGITAFLGVVANQSGHRGE
jgi:hypothetical protein